MSDSKSSHRRSDDLDTEAAYWLARLLSEESSAAVVAAFEAWRDADAAHAAAFDRISSLYESTKGLAEDAEFIGIRKQALRDAYPLPVRRGRWRMWSGFAAAAAAAVALFFVFAQPMSAPTVFTTEIGEQSIALLPDGSRVELNTATTMRIRFSGDERRVDMTNGQAVFNVAHDPSRPFVVVANGRRITALGTEFEVRVASENLAVTLIQGRVVVDELNAVARDAALAPRTASAVELTPGQRLTAAPGSVAAVAGADLEAALSWRQGRLEFDDERLSSVVAEFNRYSVRQIVIEDASTGTLPISGSFEIGSVDNFVAALCAVYPVRYERRASDGALVVKSDPARASRPG